VLHPVKNIHYLLHEALLFFLDSLATPAGHRKKPVFLRLLEGGRLHL